MDTLALLGRLHSTATLHLQSTDPAHLLRMSVCFPSPQKSRTLTQFDLSSLLSTVGVFMYRNVFSVPPWGKRKRPLAAPDLEKLLFSTEFQCALVFLSTPFSFTVCCVCHCILLFVFVYYLMKGYKNFLCSDALLPFPFSLSELCFLRSQQIRFRIIDVSHTKETIS